MTMIAGSVAFGQESNPLLETWQTPPFSRIKNEHYVPAMRAAMEEQRVAVQRITGSKEAPTFENTIVALELSGERLEQVAGILFNMNECFTNEELQAIVAQMSPELTRHSNAINLDERLFKRVKQVYDQRERLGLNEEEMRLLEQTYKGFTRNGALLGKREKKRYAQVSERLAELQQEFNRHVLADDNAFLLQIAQEENLKGLPQSCVDAARAEAERRGVEGWVFTLKAPSYRPFMTYCESRKMRQMMWLGYNTRGNRGDENDNKALVAEIVSLRQQKARLLGYEDYASYVLDDRMAGSTARVSQFMQELLQASYPAAVDDFKAVQIFASRQGFNEPLQPWDFAFWSEKLKQHLYDFDQEALRPYFPVDSVKQGIFNLYHRLYGLSFRLNRDIEVYQPEVEAYEVRDGERLMGILYMDLFPNEGKRAGAWKTDFRSQSNLPRYVEQGTDRPLVQIVCNFTKPAGDAPALLSFDELETFMHEFGHAIHNLLSDVTYPSLSGTAVPRDFVELPSQVMENWCYEPEFLHTFARHYKTGKALPEHYIQRIKAAENFQAGWLCVRQLNFGMFDMAVHTLQGEMKEPVDVFEAQHTLNILPVVPHTGFSTAFSHIFSGGYAAGYYGYKWAEVLDADAFSAFKQAGIFDKATAERFRREILSRGGTRKADEMFRAFMGRDPNTQALIERCGFIQTIKADQ